MGIPAAAPCSHFPLRPVLARLSSLLGSRLYPRSFLKLLLLAFGAAALPLVIALVQTALEVDLLVQQSRQAVGQTAQAARASRQLLEQTVALERAARQYLVLGDAGLLADYDTLRSGFKATSSELSLLPLDEAQLTELNRTIDTEATLHERLPAMAGGKTSLARDYADLSELARGVQRISDALTDREMARLGQLAGEAEQRLWKQLLAMLLLGAGVFALAAALIARPVRELEAAVSRLGSGNFQAPVAVHGPADLERLGERLEWLRQELNALEAQKARFLRHVSHELKTPLTALREGAELLADGSAGSLSEGQRDIVAILQGKSRQLQGMIEGLLNAQRALDDLGRLQRQPLDLAEVLRQGVEAHALAAQARGLRFALECPSLLVSGDQAKLATVVDNLLSNAVKYSPAGGIIAVALQARGSQAWLEVRDQGPGVAPADRERIFDWFAQGGNRPVMAGVAGSGLGLAIARELAQAHGGRLELLAEGPPGAAFRLVLPLEP